MIGWSVDVSGLTKVDNTDGQIAYFWLLQASVRMSIQTIRLTFTDTDGNYTQLGGQCYILTSSITGPASDFSNASVTFLGTGGPEIGEIADPTPVVQEEFSDWWPVNAGDDFVDVGTVDSSIHLYNLLATDEILDVWRSGSHLDLVTGTPGNAQCSFDTGALKIFVDPTNPFNSGETLFIEFKR